MKIKMEYGKTGLVVDLPDKNVVGPIELKAVTPLENSRVTLQESLKKPIQSKPLSELASGKQSACILICDITRPVPNELILSEVLPVLEEAGIPRENILILIATGLHRPNEGDELIELVGEEIAKNYRVENHHGTIDEEHKYLGTTERDVPVWIDSRYLDAELKITTGLIEPHLMAGYSGGRKLICPGIASLKTVRAWHSPAFLEHPKADCGFLDGNPVHEENTLIGRMAGCDFIVNVTLDKNRKITSVVAGDMEQAFLQGVKNVEQFVKVSVDHPCDIVVTSSAGYPLDTTFYQSVKGLIGVLPIIKEGGTIIITADLSEGIGSPEFQSLFKENANLDQFMERIMGDDYFVMDQWQMEEMAKVCRKAEVVYVSDGMPAETINTLFVNSAPSVEEAVQDALGKHGSGASIAVIPKGPYVLPVLAEG